jgi:hypothetical protein
MTQCAWSPLQLSTSGSAQSMPGTHTLRKSSTLEQLQIPVLDATTSNQFEQLQSKNFDYKTPHCSKSSRMHRLLHRDTPNMLDNQKILAIL